MLAQKILIMGLPGSGKTFFAQKLKTYLEENSSVETMPSWRYIDFETAPTSYKSSVDWFNADQIRQRFNDWDFSRDGRIRQSLRMLEFALKATSDYVICDFIAPLPEMRENFKADWTIWMDTVDKSQYEDTNNIFVAPKIYDFRITEKNAEKWVEFVGSRILRNQRRPQFDWKKETVLLLGRYQPWHAGHRALFEQAITKTGQVIIQVRDCQGWKDSNPFTIDQIKEFIRRDLDPIYQGQYEIMQVPNIVEINYGRDVGYKINKIELPQEIQEISATKIRQDMGLK